nr:phosphatidylglycerophosphatase A [Candidatus Symbiobacter mobilis]
MKVDPTKVQDIAYREVGAKDPAVAPTARFLLRHPAHIIAMGFGSGLSPVAPGTVGTLWAWAAFLWFQPYLHGDVAYAAVLGVSVMLGWWVCTITARNLRVHDPASVVWDEIVAFWLILWLIEPTTGWEQLAAFALFRFFDAVKPGPVGWADRLYRGVDTVRDPAAWRKAGWGIMLDDLVAAFCTLLVLALWRAW